MESKLRSLSRNDLKVVLQSGDTSNPVDYNPMQQS